MPDKVPPHSDPQIIQAYNNQSEKEEKRLQKTFVPIQDRHEVDDKVWVMNTNKSKLQTEKIDPAIILKVNKNNTYLVQELGKQKQDKFLHHDCLRPCKARQKQQETVVPATKQQAERLSPSPLDPPARFQVNGVVTCNLIIQSLGDRLGSQLKFPNSTT
ncbi:hypothetical protein DSO57_1036188 [Entomophthora muscae]|uniref:Uncharacterized protein n=1 Tax=Entomophthora muscae TaxID=34485 RepID=A0ACC2SNK5_9FUNG|nr:hypothetical protein DSO57_1036188 [Entomophthora muscae]